jgi:hypothetical protein
LESKGNSLEQQESDSLRIWDLKETLFQEVYSKEYYGVFLGNKQGDKLLLQV